MNDLTTFIVTEGDHLVTDSRAVAIAFGKQHRNVRRGIDAMLTSKVPEIHEHAALNFERSSYIDSTGRRQPMYRMTADGLSELAMSFTGDTSRVIRIRFLAAFREVARRLESREKTILDMLHEHDRRSAVSVARARIGSKLMHERRKEKPELDDEEKRLKEIAQPKLFRLDRQAPQIVRQEGGTA